MISKNLDEIVKAIRLPTFKCTNDAPPKMREVIGPVFYDGENNQLVTLQTYRYQYLDAAKGLVWALEKDKYSHSFPTMPFLYLCRHALELFLKDNLSRLNKDVKKIHGLKVLLSEFEAMTTSIPEEITGTIMDFAEIDPKSTESRYAFDGETPALFDRSTTIDLSRIITNVSAVCSYLDQVTGQSLRTPSY